MEALLRAIRSMRYSLMSGVEERGSFGKNVEYKE